jgi:hypothetical protein
VYFRQDENSITVLRILHGRRNRSLIGFEADPTAH